MNSIFGPGADGPFELSAIRGNAPAISISADNNKRKRVIVFDPAKNSHEMLHRDIDGDASLYITTADSKNVLLETVFKNGVRF